MMYDEFTLVAPHGELFRYDAACHPLPRADLPARGAAATTREGWRLANWICATYFNVSFEDLEQAVSSAP
jgi:hypothetical protein